jgi:hypothetical protein
MAWRPTDYLIDGELDNTAPGRVAGWMRFAGLDGRVTLDLKGDLLGEARGSVIRLSGGASAGDPEAARYMDGFEPMQAGSAGDMSAGDFLPVSGPMRRAYLEWSGPNGRVVLEPDHVEVIDAERKELEDQWAAPAVEPG